MKNTFTLLMLAVIFFTQAQQKHTVYFDFDIDEANSSSVTRLDDWMTQNKNAIIEKVYGYADSKGNNDYNIHLSQRRANDVLNRLKAYGIAVNNNVEVKAFGEDFEQDKNETKNRKVDIYYSLNDEVRPEPKPDDPDSYEYEFSQRVKLSRVGDKFKLDNLNFYGGTAELLPESRPVLAGLLKVMKENPNLKIEIQGHVCCNLNKDHPLSKERAITVYTYLQVHGIDTSRISYKNFGGSSPIYKIPEMTEMEKTANRRVEIEIIAN
ncbi:OmpA family protein [Flavobacterium beibuense]|uniref:Peptidoglycan-associated lipoprotein n=1 Tax=Flavobacterium beibuense TaxID=657326 RepID=A0A444W9C4_9FLAO|nr:OmpA family protein [Flavobacterium beibuense]RYJ42352.1 Peptidoglycan-associated lipoprotein [Flavobacterium beibuense]